MKNPQVFWLSILALGFVVLAFTINWLFLIGAVILMIINQRKLMKSK